VNGDILTTIDFRRFYDLRPRARQWIHDRTKNIITPFSFGKVHLEGNRIVRVEETAGAVQRDRRRHLFHAAPPFSSSFPTTPTSASTNLIAKMLNEGRPSLAT